MAERGISSEVTKKFCEEVHYTVKSKQYYAVGFITDNDGYVLRNKYSKIFYNPQPNKPNNKLTTIGGRAQNGKCLVFEVFCDFLAYMELERKGDTVVKSIGEVERAYILNSTNTLNNTDVVTEITQHKEVFGFFDNDKTGCEAAQKLMHELNRAGGTYHHAMPYSPEYNDLNDYLCHTNNKKIEKNIAEMDEIKKLAIVHGNFMTAPDGSHSDMTEEQWCFSRTMAFKKLIGDWEFTKIKENLITDKGEPAGFIVNRIKTLLEKGFVEDLDYAIGGIELSETQKRTIILGGEVLLKNVRNSKDEKKNLLIKYDAKKCDFVHRETIENKTETQNTKKIKTNFIR